MKKFKKKDIDKILKNKEWGSHLVYHTDNLKYRARDFKDVKTSPKYDLSLLNEKSIKKLCQDFKGKKRFKTFDYGKTYYFDGKVVGYYFNGSDENSIIIKQNRDYIVCMFIDKMRGE